MLFISILLVYSYCMVSATICDGGRAISRKQDELLD